MVTSANDPSHPDSSAPRPDPVCSGGPAEPSCSFDSYFGTVEGDYASAEGGRDVPDRLGWSAALSSDPALADDFSEADGITEVDVAAELVMTDHEVCSQRDASAEPPCQVRASHTVSVDLRDWNDDKADTHTAATRLTASDSAACADVDTPVDIAADLAPELGLDEPASVDLTQQYDAAEPELIAAHVASESPTTSSTPERPFEADTAGPDQTSPVTLEAQPSWVKTPASQARPLAALSNKRAQAAESATTDQPAQGPSVPTASADTTPARAVPSQSSPSSSPSLSNTSSPSGPSPKLPVHQTSAASSSTSSGDSSAETALAVATALSAHEAPSADTATPVQDADASRLPQEASASTHIEPPSPEDQATAESYFDSTATGSIPAQRSAHAEAAPAEDTATQSPNSEAPALSTFEAKLREGAPAARAAIPTQSTPNTPAVGTGAKPSPTAGDIGAAGEPENTSRRDTATSAEPAETKQRDAAAADTSENTSLWGLSGMHQWVLSSLILVPLLPQFFGIHSRGSYAIGMLVGAACALCAALAIRKGAYSYSWFTRLCVTFSVTVGLLSVAFAGQAMLDWTRYVEYQECLNNALNPVARNACETPSTK